MKPEGMPERLSSIWDEIVRAYGEGAQAIEGPDLEAYCGQVATLRDAQRRLASDGYVVAGPKGEPIPHPAVVIERQAQDEIRKWGSSFRPRRRGSGKSDW